MMHRFLLLLWVPAVLGQTTSSVTDVTLHPLGATVTRTVSAEIPADRPLLQIRDLPAWIDAASLQVEAIEGTAPIAVAGRTERGDVATEAMVAQARVNVQDLAIQRKALEAQLAGLAQQLALLEDLMGWRTGAASEEREPRHFTQEDAAQVSTMLNRVATIHAEKAKLESQLVSLERQEQEAGEQLAHQEAAFARSKEPPVSLADVAFASGGPTTFRLSYDLPTAAWAPGATLELAPGAESATLKRWAQVLQASGEIWQDATLTFDWHARTKASLKPLHAHFGPLEDQAETRRLLHALQAAADRNLAGRKMAQSLGIPIDRFAIAGSVVPGVPGRTLWKAEQAKVHWKFSARQMGTASLWAEVDTLAWETLELVGSKGQAKVQPDGRVVAHVRSDAVRLHEAVVVDVSRLQQQPDGAILDVRVSVTISNALKAPVSGSLRLPIPPGAQLTDVSKAGHLRNLSWELEIAPESARTIWYDLHWAPAPGTAPPRFHYLTRQLK